ncbi:MAG: hypothetical protein ACC645_01355 [Pirellulales bacterium]
MASGLSLARGDRRRRVLTEEVIGAVGGAIPADPPVDAVGQRASGKRYAEGAAYDHRPRLTDIVPLRRVAIAGLFVLGALLVAGLVWIDALAAKWTALVPPEPSRPLQLDALRSATSSSVAGWFASSMLLVAPALAWLIFSVRRYRVDDYHGRYRVWLYVAAISVMWSIDITAHLHPLLANQLTQWTGWGPLGGAVWSLLLAGLLAGVVGIRLLIEVSESRVALTLLVATYALWTTALLAQFELVPGIDNLPIATLFATCLLGGHVLLLTTQLCYARHVTRDADGHLPLRVRTPRPAKSDRKGADSTSATSKKEKGHVARPRRSESKPTSKTNRPLGSDSRAGSGNSTKAAEPAEPAVPVEPPRTSRPRVVEWTDGTDGPDQSFDGDEGHDPQRKLSKAERKRLRKQKQQQRRAA